MNTTLPIVQPSSNSIVEYQSSDGVVQLDVRLADETVWLTQKQMAWLFDTKPQNITIHIGNIYKEEELEQDATCKDFLQVQTEGGRTVRRMAKFYNLDVIISVGYRVKSRRGTQFRQWANRILKEYLLKGYSVNNRLERLEQRVSKTEEKIDFFVRTALPPVEGVFYNGQIFDAYVFATDLIKSAKKSITLIDNYIDESVLMMLAKRGKNVKASILTGSVSKILQLDIDKQFTISPYHGRDNKKQSRPFSYNRQRGIPHRRIIERFRKEAVRILQTGDARRNNIENDRAGRNGK